MDYIYYIELKTGFQDDGPAWIGKVKISKSGTTIYFNNKSFRKAQFPNGNYIDIETNEVYWISHPKKNQQDRHKFGNGKVIVQDSIKNKYLEMIDKSKSNTNYIYEYIEECYPIDRINEIQNTKLI